MKWILHVVLTTLIFSLWAFFALLFVNNNFHDDLPGYTIGRLCIWEAVAFVIAAITAYAMIRRWGSITINDSLMHLHKAYGVLFLCYLIIVITLAIWQFYLFSLNF